MKKKKKRTKQKEEQKNIARERIQILISLADKKAHDSDLKSSDRYIKNARQIAMKFNLRIPREYKRKFCSHCYSYLLPSVTSHVRLDSVNHRVRTKCLHCGNITYYGYAREIKEKKNDRKRKNQNTANR